MRRASTTWVISRLPPSSSTCRRPSISRAALGLSLLEIVLVFLLVDLFDNVGTLVAVTKRAGLMAPDGSIPRLNRILIVDSLAMMVGATSGTSPVSSYIESAAGVAVGGRTGLTSVVVGILFLCTLFFAPLVQAIPTAATAPALILVGGMMMGALAEVDWVDPLEAIPGVSHGHHDPAELLDRERTRIRHYQSRGSQASARQSDLARLAGVPAVGPIHRALHLLGVAGDCRKVHG